MEELLELTLQHLEEGINTEKKLITETHNFEAKLHVIDNLLGACAEVHEGEPELMGVLIEVFEIVELLRDKLRLLNRKEVHLVQELQAAKKAGNKWIAQHGEKIEEELQEWEKVSDTRLAGIHQAMKDISKAMADQKEDFEDDVRTILDRLHNVFLTYEAIFKK